MAEADRKALKAELKAFEAEFRARHGRDPTKNDIKAVPDMAAKYKAYNKPKMQPPPVPPKASSSTSSANLPPQLLKTPTKARSSRLPILPAVSPSKKDLFGSPTKHTTTVISNSPNKLRDLASQHSVFGSPNKKSSSFKDPFAEEASQSSPRRAANPFRSPAKPKRRDEEEGWNDFFNAPFVKSVKPKPSRENLFEADGNGKGKGKEKVQDVEMNGVENDDDNEIVGPSPVKPKPGGGKFVPLILDDPFAANSVSIQSASSSGHKPKVKVSKIFESEFGRKESALGKKDLWLQEKENERNRLKKERELERDEERRKEDEAESKKKARREAKGKGAARKKAKVAQNDSGDEEMEMEDKNLRKAFVKEGEIMRLDIADSEDDEDRKGLDTVIVRPRRAYGRDVNGGSIETEDGEITGVGNSDASLFYHDDVDLLGTSAPIESEQDEEKQLASSQLPSELLSVLSLHASPTKKVSKVQIKEREQTVSQLLGGSERKAKGLLDLGSSGDDEDPEEGEDDDWDSEAEGWDAVGAESMDGYYKDSCDLVMIELPNWNSG